MKIYLAKNDKGILIPAYASDLEEVNKMKVNRVYAFEAKKERNYQFLKKFMALCKIGCENSKNVEMPFDTYRKYATIKAGFFKTYATPKGVFVEAESIAFANMDEDKFAEVYNKTLDFIIKDTQATKEDIEENLLSFM